MRWVAVLCCALWTAACDPELSLEDRACPCVDGYVCCTLTNRCVPEGTECELTLEPRSAKLRLGAPQRFLASLPVEWSVDEEGGGSIGPDGEYRAPPRPGTYHVRARTPSGASQSAEVVVGPQVLEHFAGVAGGKGTADGIGRDARFTRPVSIAGDAEHLYVSDGLDTRWYDSHSTIGTKCVEQCATAVDQEACIRQQLGPWQPVLHPAGVRRISRATHEVTWLFRDTPVSQLALEGRTLYLGKTRATYWFIPEDGITEIDTCVFGPASDARPEIVAYDLETGTFTRVAGTDAPGPRQDGVGTAARFGWISGMVAYAGKLYVTDSPALREVDPSTGKVTTLAAGPDWEGESIAQTDFGGLGDVAADGDQLYLLEPGGTAVGAEWVHTIWSYSLADGSIGKISYVTGSSDGARSLCFDEGNLDVTRRIAFTSDRCIHTDAIDSRCDFGTNESGSEDGWGSARFGFPQGIWCTGDGTYYVTDEHNATIRKLGGGVTTIAGEPEHRGHETAIPPGPAMRLASPYGVTADASGSVVIATGLSSSDPIFVWRDPRGEFSTYTAPNLAWWARPALDPAGMLHVPAVGGVLHLDLSKAFYQQLRREVAGTYRSTPTYADQLAFDGVEWLYASCGDGCNIARLNTSSGAYESFAEGSSPLAVDGSRQLFAGAGPIFRIDIATREATRLPEPPDGWHATGLAYDPAGVLYVAERSRQRVRGLVVETGEVFDVVGELGSKGVQRGRLPASLSAPAGVALLPDGSLLIADPAENVLLVAR